MDLWREDKLPLQRKETLDLGATTSMGTQVSPGSHQLSFVVVQSLPKCLSRLLAGSQLAGDRTRTNFHQGGGLR